MIKQNKETLKKGVKVAGEVLVIPGSSLLLDGNIILISVENAIFQRPDFLRRSGSKNQQAKHREQ